MDSFSTERAVNNDRKIGEVSIRSRRQGRKKEGEGKGREGRGGESAAKSLTLRLG